LQPEASQSTGKDLREYIRILRERKWSVLLVTGIVVGVSMFLALRETPVYTSEARVLVLPTAPTSSPFFFLATINMDTEAGLVETNSVAQIVRTNEQLKSQVDPQMSGLSVSVETGTEILDIDYTSGDPAHAQRLAQGFAEAYLQSRQQQAADQVKSQISEIDRKIHDVSSITTKLQTQIKGTKSRVKKNALKNQLAAQKGRLSALQGNLADLSGGSSVQPGGEIVQPADLPSSPSNAGPIQKGVLGFVVGIMLGVGVALLRERLDDHLRGREDLESHLGAPVLAVIPKVHQWHNRKEPRLTTLKEPRAPASEAYRTLRTAILFKASQGPLKVIMVTSPSAGDGKTTTAANLSVALAQAGKEVVVVSADLRRPRIHTFFDGVSNMTGLVDVLTGDCRVEQAIQSTGVEHLRVLACGPLSARPGELLHAPQMIELLNDLRTMTDFVIIDSAPALAVADSLAMAPLVDGVLFVAEAQKTDRQAVDGARDQLEQVGAPVIGAVMNSFDPSRNGGSYYYRYTYRYGDWNGADGGNSSNGADSGNGSVDKAPRSAQRRS
jgi:succinoglycan biosynthesis transport protein ExoP